MVWIKVIDEAQAEGALKEAYTEVGAARGRVANILKVHSVSPEVMRAHLTLYRHLMFGPSDLSRAERESIWITPSS